MQNILFKIRILNPSFENKRSYVVKCDFIEGFSNIVSDKQNVFFWWTETFKLQSLIMLRMSAVVVASIKPLHLFHATSQLCWCWRPRKDFLFLMHSDTNPIFSFGIINKSWFLVSLCLLASLVKEFDHRSRTWLKGHFEATTHTLLLTRPPRPWRPCVLDNLRSRAR